MKSILTKKCVVCGKKFIKSVNCSLKDWNNKRKCCSIRCENIRRKGIHFSPKTEFSKERHFIPKTAIKKGEHFSKKTEFKKGNIPYNKGKKMLVEKYKKLKKAGFFEPKFGKKSSNWKGGITKLGTSIRTLKKYKEWRDKIYKRDNWTCQKCGARSQKGKKVKLHAHHCSKDFYKILAENKIKTTQDAIKCKELWDIKNGKTLCISCHKQTDSYLVNQYTIN